MTLIASDLNVEVEATTDAAVAITAITNANPAVATATGNALSDGDWIKISTSDGMANLNEQLVRVTNVAVDDFELEGIDSTNYTAFSTGSFEKVATWYTLCQSTSIDIGNATPSELDGTTLCSTKQVTLYGLPGSISGTIDIQHDPGAAAIKFLKGVSTSTLVAFRVTWSDDSISGFGAKCAYSGGFSAAINTIVTGQIPVTVPAEIVEYPAP